MKENLYYAKDMVNGSSVGIGGPLEFCSCAFKESEVFENLDEVLNARRRYNAVSITHDIASYSGEWFILGL